MIFKNFLIGNVERVGLTFALLALLFAAITKAQAITPIPDVQILLKVTQNSVVLEGDQDDVVAIEYQSNKSPDLSYYEFQTAGKKARGRALVHDDSIFPILFQGFGDSETQISLDKAADSETSEGYIAVKRFKSGMSRPREEGRILTGEESQQLTFSYFDTHERLLAKATNTTILTDQLQAKDTLTWTLDVYRADPWTSKLMMTVITVTSSELFRAAIASGHGYRKIGLAALGVGAVVGTGALATVSYLKAAPKNSNPKKLSGDNFRLSREASSTEDTIKEDNAARPFSRKPVESQDRKSHVEDKQKAERKDERKDKGEEQLPSVTDLDEDKDPKIDYFQEASVLEGYMSVTLHPKDLFRAVEAGDIVRLKAYVNQQIKLGAWPPNVVNVFKDSMIPEHRQTLLQIVTQLEYPTYNHKRIARYLLEIGADPNLFDPDFGKPILQFIRQPILQDAEMLKLYLEKGANASGRKGQAFSPLGLILFGAENGYLNGRDLDEKDLILKVRYLVQAGANINEKQEDSNGSDEEGPYHWVRQGFRQARQWDGSVEFYEGLLKALNGRSNSLEMKIATVESIMAFTGAASPDAGLSLSSSLSGSAPVETKPTKPYVPKPVLFTLAALGRTEELNQFIVNEVHETGWSAEVIVNVVDDHNPIILLRQTPLHLAARGGHLATVTMLLGHKANPNIYHPVSGKPILQDITLPAMITNPPLIRALLNGGALAYSRKAEGSEGSPFTPLGLMALDAATRKGVINEANRKKLEIVKELLNRQRAGNYANVFEIQYNGSTPYSIVVDAARDEELDGTPVASGQQTYLQALIKIFEPEW